MHVCTDLTVRYLHSVAAEVKRGGETLLVYQLYVKDICNLHSLSVDEYLIRCSKLECQKDIHFKTQPGQVSKSTTPINRYHAIYMTSSIYGNVYSSSCLPWQSNSSLTTKFALNILFLLLICSKRGLPLDVENMSLYWHKLMFTSSLFPDEYFSCHCFLKATTSLWMSENHTL